MTEGDVRLAGIRAVVRGETGVALVTVLLVFSILLTLTLGALGLALTNREVSINEVKSARALYAAEAGLSVALAQLQADPAWSGFPPGALPPEVGNLEGARIKEIRLLPQGDVLEVQARGEYGGLTRQVAAWLQRPVWAYGLVLGGGPEGTVSITNAELRGGGTFVFPAHVEIKSNVAIEGWVAAWGNIDNKSSGISLGGLKAVGSIDRGPFSGNVVPYAPPALPRYVAPNVGSYRNRAEAVWEGDLDLGEDGLQFADDSYHLLFVGGNLSIDNIAGGNGSKHDGGQGGGQGKKEITYRGRVVLVAGGNITVKADILKTDQASALALVAGGNIDIDNHAVEAVFWAGGALEAKNQAVIRGAVAARTLNAKDDSDGDGKGKLNFDLMYGAGLVARLMSGDSPLLQCDTGFKLVRWWARGS